MSSDAEDEKPAVPSPEVATRDGLLGALADATPEQQAALREDQVTNAVGFLTNLKVVVRIIAFRTSSRLLACKRLGLLCNELGCSSDLQPS